jgi:hypothetical protein
MGRRKREGNHSLSLKKVLQNLEQNKENGYPGPDSDKTKINYTSEPNEAHKNILKEEILQVINENFRDVTRHGKPKHTGGTQEIPRGQKQRIRENTQKQINEIIKALNKHHTETETTINREINELR